MADEIIEELSSDKTFNDKLLLEFNDFNSLSITSKAAASNTIFIKAKQYEAAMKIAGETILDLDLENDELKEKLYSYGEYNKEEINKKVQFKKLNGSNEDNNKRIRKRLLRTLEKSKSITET